jgi:hypothetical protein
VRSTKSSRMRSLLPAAQPPGQHYRIDRTIARTEEAGVPEPSEDEAMRIAVAEQHAHHGEVRGPGG